MSCPSDVNQDENIRLKQPLPIDGARTFADGICVFLVLVTRWYFAILFAFAGMSVGGTVGAIRHYENYRYYIMPALFGLAFYVGGINPFVQMYRDWWKKKGIFDHFTGEVTNDALRLCSTSEETLIRWQQVAYCDVFERVVKLRLKHNDAAVVLSPGMFPKREQWVEFKSFVAMRFPIQTCQRCHKDFHRDQLAFTPWWVRPWEWPSYLLPKGVRKPPNAYCYVCRYGNTTSMKVLYICLAVLTAGFGLMAYIHSQK